MPAGVSLQGVVVGLLGALVAVGMSLVYRTNRVLNFAQVQLGLAPAALAVSLVAYGGFGYLLAASIGLVGSVLVGCLVELVVIRRFFRSPRLILSVATIGIAQLLGAAALFVPEIWSHQPTAQVVHVPLSISFSVYPLVFTADHIAALVLAPAAMAAVAIALRTTSIGIAVRASAERGDRASLLGIPVRRLQTAVWAAAAALSFIGVFLQAGILGLPVGIDLGFTVLLAALAAMVLGDLVDLPAVALAAVALGVLQQGVLWNNESDPGLVDPVLAVVVVVAMLARRARSSRAEAAAVSTWAVSADVRQTPVALRRCGEVRAVRWATAVAAAAVVLALPLMLSGNAGNQLKASAVVVFVVVAISVVMLTGWSGQLTLGQMSLVAVGAATGAHATQAWHLDLTLALLVAGLATAAVAAVVSLPTLRLRGFFPAVTTLAFAMATTRYLLNPTYFGWIPDQRVTRPPLFGRVDVSSQSAYYYFCLALPVARGPRPARRTPVARRADAARGARERAGRTDIRHRRRAGQGDRVHAVRFRRGCRRLLVRAPAAGVQRRRLRA